MKPSIVQALNRLRPQLQTFKYPALILLIGLLLVLIPSKKPTPQAPAHTETETSAPSEDDYCRAVERQLARILSQIDGAGRVEVMLTLKAGQTVHYQTDFENSNQRNGESVNGSARQSTVILQRGSAYDEAAVVNTEYPSFLGALIVSEGAGDPAVRLALSAAVSSLLGLGADKITVVKMK